MTGSPAGERRPRVLCFPRLLAVVCVYGVTNSAAVSAPAMPPELPPLTARGKLALRSVSANAHRVGRFHKFELTCNLSATYDSPFDPDQVDVRAEFIAPDGKTTGVNGFFYQPYRLLGADTGERAPLLEPAGPPVWKVRFTPTQPGVYRYRVWAQDPSGRVAAPVGTFSVTKSERHGFVRVSKSNPRYFAFSDGTPFFPVGQNLQNDWPVYRHSRLLAASGCNAVRAWTFCHWTWLEWTFRPNVPWAGPGHWLRSYGGAGVYNQRIAWIADHHLSKWEQDGLYVMFCLGNGTELDKPDRYDSWGGHPYNAANGGFLRTGQGFWTVPRARKLYKQRLRYLAARYGYSPNLWAWEFWNEIGRENEEIVTWHREMAAWLKTVDPNRHLITTSHWGNNPEQNRRTWALPDLDFTQSHNYAGPVTIRARTLRMLALSPKPHLIGEGGGANPGKNCLVDPEGIDFHNSLWAGALSGAAGATLPWWWRERIEPKHLFRHYTALARFVRAVPWTTPGMHPLAGRHIRVSLPGGKPAYRPVLIVPQGPGWGRKAPRERFTLLPSGELPHVDEFSPVLFGSGRHAWKTEPVLHLDAPVDGRLVLHLGETSHAVLEVDLDGRTVVHDESLNVPRQGVDRNVSIALPAGRHTVSFRNAGSDWLRLGYLLFTAWRDAGRFPDVEVYAVGTKTFVAAWFHHPLNEWVYRELGVRPQQVVGARITVSGLDEGRYRGAWWDTYAGKPLETVEVACRHGQATLNLPPLTTDVACVLRKRN